MAPILSPLRLLKGASPIINRDFVHHLRTARAFRITLITLFTCGMLPLLLWPDPGQPMPETVAKLAFETYRGTFFASLLIFVPVITASSIAQEREAGTYEMLAMTHITMWQLLIGKLIAATGYFVILIILTFPLACTFFLLGGSDVWDFSLSLLAMAILVPSLGLIGLSCSVRSKNSAKSVYHASIISILFLLVALQGGLFGGMGLTALVQGIFSREIDPITMGFLAGSLAYAGAGGAFGIDLLISVRSQVRRAKRFSTSKRNYRTPAFSTAQTETNRPKKTLPQLNLKKHIPRTNWTKTILQKMEEGIPDKWNPFFANALRYEAFGSANLRRIPFWTFFSIFIIIFLVVLPLYLSNSYSAALHIGFMVGSSALLLYLVAAIPGPMVSSIALEMNPLRFELIRGTKLTSTDILKGKAHAIMSGMFNLLPLGLGFLLILTFLSFSSIGTNQNDAGELLALGVIFTMVFIVLSAFGLATAFLSTVLFPVTIQAQSFAYFIVFGFLFILPWQLWLWLPHEWASMSSPAISYVNTCLQFSAAWDNETLAYILIALSFIALITIIQLSAGLLYYSKKRMREI